MFAAQAGEEGARVDEQVRAFMTARVPFWQTLGFSLVSASEEGAILEGEYRRELSQNDVLHGGVLASLIDSACACAAIARTYPDAYATTINLQVSYMRAVTSGRLRAEGTCVSAGRRVLFCEARVFDEKGALVGSGSSQLLRVPLPARRTGA